MWIVTNLILCFSGVALLAVCINSIETEISTMPYIKRPRSKYYVTLGKRQLLISEKSVDDACVAMLAMHFDKVEEIPDSFWESDVFTVDYLGFRPVEGSLLETDNGLPYTKQPDFIRPIEEIQDYFERLTRLYDPFCQYDDEGRIAKDDYFHELGEEE